MNIAIAISHKEKPIAGLWARWIAALGLPEGTKIFLTFDQKVDSETYSEVYHTLAGIIHVDVEIYFGDDPGYPGAANKMFIFTARRAAKDGRPFLWMETDMTPLRKGWFEEVVDEYDSCGKPFLGPILSWYSTPHLNGTAVYPANWEEITNITETPNHYPWDTFSRTTVTDKGLAAVSKTIQHHNGSAVFPASKNLLGDFAVFHPCKDGSLINMLNKKSELIDGGLFKTRLMHIMVEGGARPKYLREVGALHLRRFHGAQRYIAKLSSIETQVLAFRQLKFSIISESEYKAYLKYL